MILVEDSSNTIGCLEPRDCDLAAMPKTAGTIAELGISSKHEGVNGLLLNGKNVYLEKDALDVELRDLVRGN